MAPKNKPLVMRDEIHGDISFDRVLRCVVDHPDFQRLRYIKQLGLAEYVFPCATHTRFQHSLGAAYLAGQYFESLIQGWAERPLIYDGVCGTTRFHGTLTFEKSREVLNDPASYEFWFQVASLAGMLHDIGHGPWSHSFENLELKQDFSEVTGRIGGAMGAYFAALLATGAKLKHEDLSVLYIHQILHDLEAQELVSDADRFFLPVALLVNRKASFGKFGERLDTELAVTLENRNVRGGVEMHRLIRPLISGPFDVDRIDYIQRDGRNCGVSIGGIEWRRIVTKLAPCLASHPNDKGEPTDVVLVSHMKNQHVLDDFIFSLFQMYAQVYMHPKIVGLEEEIRRLLAQRAAKGFAYTVNFEKHRRLSDDNFRAILSDEFGVPEVNQILLRQTGARFRVASLPDEEGNRVPLEEAGFKLLDTQDRPMLKDSVGVFLYSSLHGLGGISTPEAFIRPWAEVSPIARQFHEIRYSPKIWIKADV